MIETVDLDVFDAEKRSNSGGQGRFSGTGCSRYENALWASGQAIFWTEKRHENTVAIGRIKKTAREIAIPLAVFCRNYFPSLACRSSRTKLAPVGPRPRNQVSSLTSLARPSLTASIVAHKGPAVTVV